MRTLYAATPPGPRSAFVAVQPSGELQALLAEFRAASFAKVSDEICAVLRVGKKLTPYAGGKVGLGRLKAAAH